MKDNTPLYMFIIVGIVAIVGIIVMITSAPSQDASELKDSGNSISGNVVAENTGTHIDWGIVGRLFFTAFLLGIVVFLYKNSNY